MQDGKNDDTIFIEGAYMNALVKNRLNDEALKLLDKADEIALSLGENELSEVLRRSANIGLLAVLNSDSISNENLVSVVKMIDYASRINLDDKVVDVSKITSLSQLDNIIEDAFRNSGILLDREERKMAI